MYYILYAPNSVELLTKEELIQKAIEEIASIGSDRWTMEQDCKNYAGDMDVDDAVEFFKTETKTLIEETERPSLNVFSNKDNIVAHGNRTYYSVESFKLSHIEKLAIIRGLIAVKEGLVGKAILIHKDSIDNLISKIIEA